MTAANETDALTGLDAGLQNGQLAGLSHLDLLVQHLNDRCNWTATTVGIHYSCAGGRADISHLRIYGDGHGCSRR